MHALGLNTIVDIRQDLFETMPKDCSRGALASRRSNRNDGIEVIHRKRGLAVSVVIAFSGFQGNATAMNHLLLAQIYPGPQPGVVYPGLSPNGSDPNFAQPGGFVPGMVPQHSFDPNSVRSKDAGNRYVIFEGITTIRIPAKPSSVIQEADFGYVKCYGVSGFTDGVEYPYNPSFDSYGRRCSQYGFRPAIIAPAEPARDEQRSYTYELDCLDRTFDRRKDNLPWKSVADDQTAAMVASRYCRGGVSVLAASEQLVYSQAVPPSQTTGNSLIPSSSTPPQIYSSAKDSRLASSSDVVPETGIQQQGQAVLAANGLKQAICTADVVIIKFINGSTICAEPTREYSPGRYYANKTMLIKLK